MTEPTSAAGTFAGYKLALFSLPVLASLLAFWLGLRFVPLRKDDPRGDLLNRVMACIFSSFLLGIPALVLMVEHWPWVFQAGMRLAEMAALTAFAGFFAVTGCVLVVCSIPGPWIMAAVFLWLKRSEGQTITELADQLRDELSGKGDKHKGGEQ
ncbi:hypothetical protein DZC30_04955 [Comamonas testosteroni]|uniref:Transmembrane protein n=1 Tax=Comamonas testosteroni TaxID=285 RepID=A0A373FRY1_COMTE|nr:hypothetical protein [Comamonas testosteroni]RGE46262.1 hypothetical protein DZC30_04955 [Comamonas testosteroni]